MHEKTFVFVFLISFLLFMSSIAAFNYKVDLYYLFSRSYLLENAVDDLLAGRIISGITNSSDRYLQKLIIEKMEKIPGTIVLGSSRSFLLRASHLGIEKTGSYYNNSVGGASLKDYMGILGAYKKRGALPGTIIIEVAPPLFDKRWEESKFVRQWQSIANEYYYFMNAINDTVPTVMTSFENVHYKLSKVKELIAYSYTTANLESIMSEEERDYRIANCKYPDVFLEMPDGSMCYPFGRRSEYKSFSKKDNRLFLQNMKKHVHQESLQQLFIKLVDYLVKNGIQVVFFLPPYNPLTYRKIRKHKELDYVSSYKKMVRDLARLKKIPVIGNYNPRVSNLSEKKFLDGQHINNDRVMGMIFKKYQKIAGKKRFSGEKENKFDKVEHTGSESYWLEAECADSIVYPLEIADDKRASAGKFLRSGIGAGSCYSPGSIMATYTVVLKEAGEYILWGRVKAAGQKRNSFFIEIDNGFDNSWEMKAGNRWHWDMVNYFGRTDPVTFYLTAGKHTIKVKKREYGAKLDKLLLTNITGFIPTGKGDAVKKQDYSGKH